MSTEPIVLTSIVKNKELPVFLKLKISDFRTREGADCYNFIKDYYKSYSELPNTEIFKEKYPSFPVDKEFKNADFYYKSLQEVNSKVDLTTLLQKTSSLFNNGSTVSDIITSIKSGINNLSVLSKTEKVISITHDNIDERLNKAIEKMDESTKGQDTVLYTLGHPLLDAAGPGFVAGGFNVIVARLGVGKTWDALFLCYKYWQKGLNPLFFSLEMTDTELGDRFDSIASGVSFSKKLKGTLNKEEWEQYTQYIKDVKINKAKFNAVFPEKCTVSVIENHIREYSPGIVFIDYVQMMRDEELGSKYKDRRLQLEDIAYGLKGLAKKYNIPIVVLAQANRETKGMPQPENIKDCDSLGAASDIIIGLHQDEENKTNKQMQIQIIKYRNGETWKSVVVPFDVTEMEFFDLKYPFKY